MTQFSHGLGTNGKKMMEQAVHSVVIETLENRQYMSSVLDTESATHAALHPMTADMVGQSTPAVGSALDAVKAEHRALANARHLAAIEKSILHFETKIRNEVHHNIARAGTAKFQLHIDREQAAFARRIAKQGGTYTPIPYADLLVGTVALVAPTLTATGVSATQINLTWTTVTGASKYTLQTSINGSNWSTLASPTTTSFAHSALAADSTHKYRVSATVGSKVTPVSTVVTAKTLVAAPRGFAAVTYSATRIDLSWIPVLRATGYKIERSTDQTTWTALAPNPALTGTSKTYSDTTITAGLTYYYRLSAIAATGTSATTTPVSALTIAGVPVLTATATSATQANLSWVAIPGAATYTVERSTDGGNTWSTIANPTAITYSNTGLSADTAYKYRVSTVNAAGTSGPSNVAIVTTLLSAPTGLTAVAASITEIDLAWNAMADVTSFKIERSTNQTLWTALTPNPALTGSSVSYADTTALAGTHYYYRLSASSTAGISAVSATADALTIPAAPVLTATVNSTTQITLNWAAVTGAASYILLRSTDGGVTYSTLTSPTLLTYANTGLAADSTYKYILYAVNAAGTSGGSATITSTTPLTAPTGLSATVISATEIDLAWNPLTDATNYKIERSLDQTAWTALVPNPALNGGSGTYADASVSAGLTYYYRISGINTAGTSAASTAVHGLTLPNVTTLSATVSSSTAINLSWTAVTSATNYKVETSTDGGNTWSTLVTQATLTYSNTGLTANTSYKYRVSAINATGTGVASTVATASTLQAAPTGVSATANSATQITVAWTPVISATGYKLERSLDQTTWTTLAPNPALAGSASSYADTTVLVGTTYYYRISAITTAGTSAASTAVHALTNPATPVLTASASSSTAINLSWTTITSATSYLLEKSTDGGTTWTTLASPTTTTYSNTGLTADTAYKYRVSAVNATGNSVASAGTTATTLLAAPTGFTATAVTATSIALAWPAVADATNYKIERSLDQTTWIALAPNPALTGSSVGYTDAAVSGGTTYYYRLSAIDAAGTSTASAAAHALTVPVAPVLAGTVVSGTQINLSWAAVTGAASYLLESSADGGITWATAASPTTTTYSNTGLTAGLSYKYRLSAVNATGNSLISNVLTLTTLLPAPTGLSSTSHSATQIDLSWNAVPNATGYKIERSTDQTAWTALVPNPVLTGSSVTYSDATASAGLTYYYRISSISTNGTSAASTAVHSMTMPVAPVLSSTVVSATQVNLSWLAIPSATTYKVEVSSDAGTTWTVLASPTTLTYSDTSGTADTSYKYRVSAINAGGASVASNIATVRTLLAAPAGFTASAHTGLEIDLAWTAVTNATNYKIERSTDNATWTVLAPNPALTGTSATYNDTAVAAGTTYFYRISAIEVAGTSATSPVMHALTYPATPTLTGTGTSTTTNSLSWTASTGATSYLLETSTDSGTTWATLASPTTNSYIDTGLTADTAYQYRVSAINATGTSSASSVATVSTLLTAPAGFTATTASATEIDLAWTAVTDASNYKIQRTLDQITWTTLVPNPALTGTSAAYNDTSVLAGLTYYYRISAIGTAGTSAPAAAVHTMTFPATPTLTAVPSSATSVSLSWTASPSATSYLLETSADGGTTWTTAVTQAGTTYSNTGLTADTSYQYRVSAINAGGTGAASSVATVSTLLAAPAGFTATAASATEIDLAWTAVTHASNYKIERSLNQTVWSTITPNPALTGTSAAYADLSVLAGTTYYYRISAIGTAGTSAAATTVHALTYPATPTLAAAVASATVVNLSWTPALSATSYLLETSVDGGTTWTTLATQAGTTYSNTGLTADTSYQYRVSAINATATGVASTVSTVSTILAAPGGFTVTAASATEIDLAWTAVTHATNYKIERSLDNSIWTTITPNPALTGTSAAYADTSVIAGTTYYYRISAINSVGTSVAATAANALTYPARPALTASVASATSVNLSWTAMKSATSYLLETSADGGTTWTTLATQAGTTYSNTGLTADTSYQYRVSAINATATGVASTVSTVSTLLLAPAGFTTTAASATEIDLAWTAVTNASNYKIERSLNQTLWTTITPNPALTGTSATYADTTVVAGTTYYYRISAIGTAGTSAPATVAHALTYPGTPTLTGTVVSSSVINLSWTSVPSATSYLIESSVDGGTTWGTLATQAGTTYSNTGLSADANNQYRVSAINATATGVASNIVTITTLLLAPAGFTATAAAGAEIDLAWTAVTHATNYKIERSLNGTAWTTITPNPALTGTSAAYADTTVLAGTTYYYRVSSIDSAGTSAPATAAHALTYAAKPTLTAVAASATVVNLSWTASLSATNYLLETSADGGTTWTTVVTQAGTSYSNTGLTADTSYQYRVSAINATGTGTASTVSTVSTLLLAPAGFTATAASATEIDLAWTAVTHATNYKIERSLNNAIWTTITPNPALTGTSAAYADTSVVGGTTYYYRISAIDAAGTSAPATAVNALTYPAAPTLSAVAVSDTEIDLTWTPVASAASYVLETSVDGGTTWTTLASPASPEYANTGLTADTAYQYRVSAVNATGTSAPSSVTTITTLLAAPTNFAGTAASATQVNLTWTAVTDATTYLIESSTDNQSWLTLLPSPALTQSSASYHDTTVLAGSTNYYRISAINANGVSVASSVVTVITPVVAPVGLTATAASTSQINLHWTADTDAGLLNFRLESSADGSTGWTSVVTIDPTATSVSDIRLTTGTTYYYRLIAVNAGGDSAPTAVVHATTL